MSAILRSLRRPPVATRWLAYGGVVPFLICAAASVFGEPRRIDVLFDVVVVYGAVMITFTGAVHWGLAMRAGRESEFQYGLSILPAVIACICLLIPRYPAVLLLILSFVVMGLVDGRLGGSGKTPYWYTALRFPVTGLVVGSLLVVLSAY